MTADVLLPILFFALCYLLIIGGLWLLLRQLPFFNLQPVFFSFLVFGAGSGWLLVRTWPTASHVYLNLFAVWLGDYLFEMATVTIPADLAADPQNAVPLSLRLPQVYLTAALLLYGLIGLILQWLITWRQQYLRDRSMFGPS